LEMLGFMRGRDIRDIAHGCIFDGIFGILL
jgi:hypothetical protein